MYNKSRICGQWGNFRVNLSHLLVKMDGKTWGFMAYGSLEDTRMGCREKDRVPLSSTLVYILAHGCCHWLRAGHWKKCHDERPSMGLQAAGAMRQRWITTIFIPAAFSKDQPTTFPFLVPLQQEHDLQRSQILQVSPVINQSNMSSFYGQVHHRQKPDSHCQHPLAYICLLQVLYVLQPSLESLQGTLDQKIMF